MERDTSTSSSPAVAPDESRGAARWTRCTTFEALTTGLAGLFTLPAKAAVPFAGGSYVTLVRQGTVYFTPLRQGVESGYEGRFVIDGRTYPGSLYYPRTGGVGLVWFYGDTGTMAGNTLGSLQPDGSYVGPLWFFDSRGNITDSGTTRFAVNVR